jgi:hypothetical protein
MNEMQPRQDIDGAAYIGYFINELQLGFTWNASRGHEIDVCHGGMGEPTFTRISFDPIVSAPAQVPAGMMLGLLRSTADRWARGFVLSDWTQQLDQVYGRPTHHSDDGMCHAACWRQAVAEHEAAERERYRTGVRARSATAPGFGSYRNGATAPGFGSVTAPGFTDFDRDRHSEARAGGNIVRRAMSLWGPHFSEEIDLKGTVGDYREAMNADFAVSDIGQPYYLWPIMLVAYEIAGDMDQRARFDLD